MNKTEHEMLKEIADKIGYELPNEKFLIWENRKTIYKMFWLDKYKADVREIIFTQEFMDRYQEELHNKYYPDSLIDAYWLLKNLDNPVQYLYNTLWLWN